MNFRANILIAAAILLCAAANMSAFEFWRHPEIAGKNSMFADVGLAPLVFTDFDFPVLPLELRLDYMPPLPVPLSLGLFFKTPNPNLNSFGTRIAYHFDVGEPNIDVFFLYVFDFGFIRNDLLEKYNDKPVDIHYFDFRVGARYFFDPLFALAVETDFKVFGIILLLSIKIL